MANHFFVTLAAALMLPTTANAGNWADVKDWPDMQESKNICRKYINTTPPAADLPDTKTMAAYKESDCESLYYGIGQPANPVAARACAFAERNSVTDGPFGGDALLMTIYANGVGAKRRLDVAIALACVLDGAPAEIDGRVTHLYQLMLKNWSGNDFSWCDDITSGVAQAYCADHDARIEGPKREAHLARIAKNWASEPAKARFLKLREATDAFIETRSGNEISPLGTAHAALAIGEQESLGQQFVEDLEKFAGGKPPCAGAEKSVDADTRLNAVYRKIQRRPANQFMEDNGNIEQGGIKETQRAWLKYRDAWIAFVASAYPEISSTSVLNWLTLRRVKQLEEYAQD